MNSNISQPGSSLRLKMGLYLLIIFSLALVFRLWGLQMCRFVGIDGGVDGVVLMRAGRNLFSGAGFSFQGRPETVHAPLFSILIGLLWYILGNLELSGHLISILAGALMVIPVYILARLIFDEYTARLSSLLTAVFPVYIYGSTEIRIASLYTLFLMTAAVLIYRTAISLSFSKALGAGVAIALVYLTRPEGVILIPLAMVIFMLEAIKKKGRRIKILVKSWGGMVFGFSLASFPYWLFLRRHLHHWTWSGRGPITLIPYFEKDLEAAKFWAYADPDRFREKWDAIGGMIGFLKDYTDDLVGRFIYNISILFKIGHSPEFVKMKIPPEVINLSIFLVVISIMGVIIYKVFKRRWYFRDSFLVMFCLPLLSYLFLTDFMHSQKSRYLYPYCGIGLIIFSRMLVTWIWRISKSKKLPHPSLAWVPAGMVVLFMVIISVLLASRKQFAVPYEYKILGLWMKDNIPGIKGDRVMSHRMGVPFYAGAEYVMTYPGSYEEVLRYARRKDADYLIIDEWTVPVSRPKLAFLLDERESPSGLKRIKTITYQGRQTILYKFKL